MDILIRLAFDESAAVRLLNWLARENARIFRLYDKRSRHYGAEPLPGVYDSGVVYKREADEVWSDWLNTMMQGHEDCDALSAARAGELMARGYRALRPRSSEDPLRYPGDGGYATAQRYRPPAIRAEVMLTTNAEPGEPGLYHCITRYWLDGREYRDDPSARLGMYDGEDAMLSRAALLKTMQSQPTPFSASTRTALQGRTDDTIYGFAGALPARQNRR